MTDRWYQDDMTAIFMKIYRSAIITFTKAVIVEAVEEEIGFTKKKSVEIIETLLEIIKRSIASGEGVLVCRFRKILCPGKVRAQG